MDLTFFSDEVTLVLMTVLTNSVVFATAWAVEHLSWRVVITESSCDMECFALVVTDPGRSSPGSKMMLVVMGSIVCSFTHTGLRISVLLSSTSALLEVQFLSERVAPHLGSSAD